MVPQVIPLAIPLAQNQLLIGSIEVVQLIFALPLVDSFLLLFLVFAPHRWTAKLKVALSLTHFKLLQYLGYFIPVILCFLVQ